MNIKEVSQQTAISKDMIRFYEKKGLLHPKRMSNGYRDYSLQDVHRIILIKQYNSLGVPLHTIKKMLKGETGIKNAFEAQLDTLKQEVEFALAKYRNAKDLQKLAAAYEQGQVFEIGYRGDMYYVPLHKENDALCTQYVNEGAGRAVFRVAKEDMYSSVLPDDVGVLMAGNPEESLGNLRKIPPHAFYRILRFIPNVQKVGPEEIQQILEEMHARGFTESGDMYIYQVLFRESDMDAIGIEIEITSM